MLKVKIAEAIFKVTKGIVGGAGKSENLLITCLYEISWFHEFSKEYGCVATSMQSEIQLDFLLRGVCTVT